MPSPSSRLDDDENGVSSTDPLGGAQDLNLINESRTLRVVMIDDDPWFVAKDIAESLNYAWAGIASISHVPEEWRGVNSVLTPRGAQEMLTLTEQGLYFFISRSDKPKALPFQKWIAGEVLPSIRKTGAYHTPPASALSPAKEFRALFGVARLLGLDRNAAGVRTETRAP